MLRIWLTAFAFGCCLISQVPSAHAQQGPTQLAPDVRLLRDTVVSVSINGHQVIPSVPVVEVPGLGFAIGKADYDTLGLSAAKPWMAVRGEEEYVILNRVPGLSLSFDPATLALAMQADVKLFSNTRVQVYNESGTQTREAATGAFLNYDLSATTRAGLHQGTAALELVGFSPYGSLVTNHLLASASAALSLNQYAPRTIRLDSYFQYDRPGAVQRIRLGDSISSSGSLGRSVNYAGLKLGTDFSLNPNLVTLPLLQAVGSARVPSTVDLYINGTLQRRIDVPAGAFSLDQIPAVTGNGNARIVIRDPQGREQVIEQPFYRTPNQLRPGLADYAIDVGALRKNYGLESNQYGEHFGSASGRIGVADWVTVEGRLESTQRGPRALGLGAVTAFGSGHSFAPSFQISDSSLGRGWGAQLGYSFVGSALRMAARLERYSPQFQQLGFAAGELAVERRMFLSAGLRLGSFTDLGIFLSENSPRGTDRVRIASLSLSHRIDRDWLISGNISQTSTVSPAGVNTGRSSNGSITLNYIADSLTVISANASATDNGTDRVSLGSVRYSRRPAIDGGWGAELEVASNQSARLRTEYLGNSGSVVAEAARFASDSTAAVRVSAQGSVAAVGSSLSSARRIDDSFVLVKAPDAPGEFVTRGGRRYRLDAKGEAILDRVQPYQQTRVAVAASSLPLEVEIGKAEERLAVPAKAGVVLQMNLRRNLPASFSLTVLGKTPPAGSKVQIAEKEFTVGLDGLVYIPDMITLGGKKQALAGRFLGFGASPGIKPVPGVACEFSLPLAVGETLLDLGEIACK